MIMSLPLNKGSSLVDLYHINRHLLKKPTSKKRTKRHNPYVAPKCSTKLEKKFTKWEKENLFVAVLKILFVFVVALMTKRLVFGVAALCLFVLEIVFKCLYRLLRRLLISRKKKTSVSFTRIEWDTSEGGVVSGCSSLTVSSEEISDMPADSDSDICLPDFTNFDGSKKLGLEDRGSGKGILESDQISNCESGSMKSRVTRREKVKSKMKKLVPRKLRKSIKKRAGFKREGTDILDDDNCEAKEYDTELDASDDSEDSDEAKADRFTDFRSSIPKYWFFCFIALAGLSQGRILAIAITLSWCLIVKIVECIIKNRKLH